MQQGAYIELRQVEVAQVFAAVVQQQDRTGIIENVAPPLRRVLRVQRQVHRATAEGGENGGIQHRRLGQAQADHRRLARVGGQVSEHLPLQVAAQAVQGLVAVVDALDVQGRALGEGQQALVDALGDRHLHLPQQGRCRLLVVPVLEGQRVQALQAQQRFAGLIQGGELVEKCRATGKAADQPRGAGHQPGDGTATQGLTVAAGFRRQGCLLDQPGAVAVEQAHLWQPASRLGDQGDAQFQARGVRREDG